MHTLGLLFCIDSVFGMHSDSINIPMVLLPNGKYRINFVEIPWRLELYLGLPVAGVVVLVCLFWTWAIFPCLQAAAITVSEGIQVCSYSCPLAGSPSTLQVWSLSTSSLHGEHLSTPPSYQHSLQLSLLFASPQANDEIFGIMVKRQGRQRLGGRSCNSEAIYLVSHVLVVSCFEYPPPHSLIQCETPTSVHELFWQAASVAKGFGTTSTGGPAKVRV